VPSGPAGPEADEAAEIRIRGPISPGRAVRAGECLRQLLQLFGVQRHQGRRSRFEGSEPLTS